MQNNRLARTATHEAGHATYAWRSMLPLKSITIREDGSGLTAYTRQFSFGEYMIWVVSAFCGPEAEVLEFGNAPIESDLRAIDRMTEALGISSLSSSELEAYRAVARSFVRRERQIIRIVAHELLRVGQMSGDMLSIVLSGC